MLKKKHRLKKEKDFKRVFKKGEKIAGDYFDLFWAKNNLLLSRVGIIISNKTINMAARRNKNKRIIREAIKNSTWLEKEPGIDLVVKLKQEIIVPCKRGALKELKSSLGKIP